MRRSASPAPTGRTPSGFFRSGWRQTAASPATTSSGRSAAATRSATFARLSKAAGACSTTAQCPAREPEGPGPATREARRKASRRCFRETPGPGPLPRQGGSLGSSRFSKSPSSACSTAGVGAAIPGEPKRLAALEYSRRAVRRSTSLASASPSRRPPVRRCAASPPRCRASAKSCSHSPRQAAAMRSRTTLACCVALPCGPRRPRACAPRGAQSVSRWRSSSSFPARSSSAVAVPAASSASHTPWVRAASWLCASRGTSRSVGTSRRNSSTKSTKSKKGISSGLTFCSRRPLSGSGPPPSPAPAPPPPPPLSSSSSPGASADPHPGAQGG